MNDDLIAFLNARLDEDETTALATIGVNERARMMGGGPAPRWLPEVNGSGITDDDGIHRVGHTWVHEREHIARHDPARVLREVEAKRAIINDLAPDANLIDRDKDGWTGIHDRDTATDPLVGDLLLRTLAGVYSDHPDYRSEWKP